MPPYWDSHRAPVDSAMPNWRQTNSTSMPPASNFWPSASFRMICSGECRRPAICRLSVLVSASNTMMEAIGPRNYWTTTRGSSQRNDLRRHPLVTPRLPMVHTL